MWNLIKSTHTITLADLLTHAQQWSSAHQEETRTLSPCFLLFLASNQLLPDMFICNRSKIKEQWKLPREINDMTPLIACGTSQKTQTSSAVKWHIIRDCRLNQKLPSHKNYTPVFLFPFFLNKWYRLWSFKRFIDQFQKYKVQHYPICNQTLWSKKESFSKLVV